MPVRLGDIIDDHCTRCTRLTDHSVVAMIDEEVKKVRCRTCNNEHNFRHGKGAQKKKPKLSAYEQVLASITEGRASAAPAKPPESTRPSRPLARGRNRSGSLRSRMLPQH